jgi:AtzE family amidohydrolase
VKTGLELARLVRSGACTAVSLAEDALGRLPTADAIMNSVTRTLADRAMAEARAVDATVAAGRDPGPLAGVPYGVKDLFDVIGLPTTAGANKPAPPASKDSSAVERMRSAGAVLVATLNMDEYAYGFATINAHYGTTRNPHDFGRLAGGSSGGSAAAVAAGLLPLSLGSDTNGSIRVPASLCGAYGLKPTHGGLPMDGVYPFVDSFDDIGPFARSVADLEAAWHALGGHSAAPIDRPRVVRLGGWFEEGVDLDATAALDGIVAYLGGSSPIQLPEVSSARSAAYLMTAYEGGKLHLPGLRSDALSFDPQTRDRLLAGALLPVEQYELTQAFRCSFQQAVEEVFQSHDVLLAPATPCTAPTVDDPNIHFGGEKLPARAALGVLTQPLSFIGLPVLAAPLHRPGRLPLGIQIIGKPGSEATLFALASRLELASLVGCTVAGGPS